MSQKFIHTLSATNLHTSDLNVAGNLSLKGVAVVVPKSGNRIKIGTISPGLIVAPFTKLEEVDIIFPEKPVDGQIMFISFTQDVKKVTFSNSNFANKSTLGPVVKAGDSITLFFHSGTNKWYKLAGGSAAADSSSTTTTGSSTGNTTGGTGSTPSTGTTTTTPTTTPPATGSTSTTTKK
jgi:hypothetical protein